MAGRCGSFRLRQKTNLSSQVAYSGREEKTRQPVCLKSGDDFEVDLSVMRARLERSVSWAAGRCERWVGSGGVERLSIDKGGQWEGSITEEFTRDLDQWGLRGPL